MPVLRSAAPRASVHGPVLIGARRLASKHSAKESNRSLVGAATVVPRAQSDLQQHAASPGISNSTSWPHRICIKLYLAPVRVMIVSESSALPVHPAFYRFPFSHPRRALQDATLPRGPRIPFVPVGSA